MRALNMYVNVTPDYGAALGFELRARDNAYYVTVSFHKLSHMSHLSSLADTKRDGEISALKWGKIENMRPAQ